MRNSKLSLGLINYLGANKEANIDVIIEIAPVLTNNSDAQSGKSKMEIFKENFFKASKPIENLIKRHGGNILGIAWINKTIKAKIPANHLRDLANCENIATIDLPEKIQQEVK